MTQEQEPIRICPSYQLPCKETREHLETLNQKCKWECTVQRTTVKVILGIPKQEVEVIRTCMLDAISEGLQITLSNQQQMIGLLMSLTASGKPKFSPQ